MPVIPKTSTIYVIPCGGKKDPGELKARVKYIGGYFKMGLAYALSKVPADNVFILSAKYGLLRLEDLITDYDQRMGHPGCVTAEDVYEQAREMNLLDRPVVALGGKAYTDVLCAVWPEASTPLAGVGGIGKQQAWYKVNTL